MWNTVCSLVWQLIPSMACPAVAADVPASAGRGRDRHVLRPERPRRGRRGQRAERRQRAVEDAPLTEPATARRGARPRQAEPEAEAGAGHHHDRPAPGGQPQPPLAPLLRLAGLLERAPPAFPRVASGHRGLPIYVPTTYYLRTEIVASTMGVTVSAMRERSGTEARVHGFGELEAVLMQRIWDHGGTRHRPRPLRGAARGTQHRLHDRHVDHGQPAPQGLAGQGAGRQGLPLRARSPAARSTAPG